MAYDHSLNIHIHDINGTSVPGAKITVFLNERPIASARSSGYSNKPTKLRFSCDAPKVKLRAELVGQESVERTVSVSDRDVTLAFKNLEIPIDEAGKKDRFVAENWVALAFGIVMLVVLFCAPMLLPAVLPQYMSSFYPKILLTILSLSAAGFGAALTGFIVVEVGAKKKGYVRAGGALAVFAIVFFWNPSGM